MSGPIDVNVKGGITVAVLAVDRSAHHGPPLAAEFQDTVVSAANKSAG